MDYTPLTYPCPKCGSKNVAQDPVCALVGNPLMLHFFCCDCNYEWDKQYEQPKDEKAKKESTTMQVSYNGFTGELVTLEKINLQPNIKTEYNLSIFDNEKKVTYSFIGVKLEDMKFMGGKVSFPQ